MRAWTRWRNSRSCAPARRQSRASTPTAACRRRPWFFVQAVRSGYRCVLTPFTASYQQQQWDEGGARSAPLAYELSTLRNNWRFMRLHGDWLTEKGYILGKLRFQAAFTAERFLKTARGVISARLPRRAA